MLKERCAIFGDRYGFACASCPRPIPPVANAPVVRVTDKLARCSLDQDDVLGSRVARLIRMTSVGSNLCRDMLFASSRA